MKRLVLLAALGASAALLAAGCAVDVPRMMKTDANLQTQVIGAIGADSALAGRMVEQLLGGEATRQSLVQSVMANGDAARAVMVMVAADRQRLDAVLGLAVQDSSTKEHVLALLKGMQMAGAK